MYVGECQCQSSYLCSNGSRNIWHFDNNRSGQHQQIGKIGKIRLCKQIGVEMNRRMAIDEHIT